MTGDNCMKRHWLCCFLLVFCLAGCGSTQEAIDREQMLQEAAELHEDALQGVIDAQKNLRETLVVQSDAANSNRDIAIEIGETGSSKNFDVSCIDFWTQEQIYTETYSEYTEYYKTPTRGSTYAIIVLKIENTSSSAKTIIPDDDFICYTDNVEINFSFYQHLHSMPKIGDYDPIINGSTSERQGSRTIQSGRAIEGYYVFEIPADAETFEMEFDEFILKCDVPH